MVHGLTGKQLAPELSFHHDDVLKHPAVSATTRMSWDFDPDVPLIVLHTVVRIGRAKRDIGSDVAPALEALLVSTAELVASLLPVASLHAARGTLGAVSADRRVAVAVPPRVVGLAKVAA